jgi:hypothetical protein
MPNRPQLDVNPAGDLPADDFVRTPVVREEHAESTLTRLIEHQAAKLPSDIFLFSAMAAMAAAVAFEIAGNSRMSRFLGMWPPALLTMGMYNKLIKIMGTR